jgi:hypothetical protein
LRKFRDRERGVVAVLAAILIVMLGAFLALSMNMGMIVRTRGELQTAADSSALAGAKELDGLSTGISTARTVAYNFAAQQALIGNSSDSTVKINSATDVKFGHWHFKTETCVFSGGTCTVPSGQSGVFEEATTFSGISDYAKVTAIKVADGRDGTADHNAVMQTVFSFFLGGATARVTGQATAVGRGARANCPLPFALPLCSLINGSAYACGTSQTLQMSNDTDDNTGWLDLGLGYGTNTPGMRDSILNRCTGTPINTADYDVGNGNNLNDQLIEALLGLDAGSQDAVVNPDTDGTSKICVLKSGMLPSMPVVDAGCPNPKFSGTAAAIRYAKVQITSVYDNNGTRYCKCPTTWPAPADSSCVADGIKKRRIIFTVLCDGNNGPQEDTTVNLRLVK